MQPFFITGTDTSAGKTHFALRLLRYCSQFGKLNVFKPVASGLENVDGKYCNPDVKVLADAQGLKPTDVNFITYSAPMAPECAARKEGRLAGFDEIVAWCRQRICRNTCFEGVGGLLVPIDHDFTVLVLAVALKLPLVVVARCGLGTINHTLLTVNAALSAGSSVAAVIISSENNMRDDVENSALAYITERLSPTPVFLLPNRNPTAPLDEEENELFSRFVSLISL